MIYFRERSEAGRRLRIALASLRVAALVVLLVMMYGWMLLQHRTDLPDLVLAVDTSASMAVVDAYDENPIPARLERRPDASWPI